MFKKIVLIILVTFTISSCERKNNSSSKLLFQTKALMTAQDTKNSTYSNISITNGTSSTIVSSGIFIASFDINDCSSCFGSVMSGDNVTGAIIEPVTFAPGQKIQIGQNYLYNIIYNGINSIRNNVGSSPCLLPGCSWNGDTNINGWCLNLNLISRNSPYTFSNFVNSSNNPANAIPMGHAGNSILYDYKFDLINPATIGNGNPCLGLIICNDQTLTCAVSTPQNQTFQSY